MYKIYYNVHIYYNVQNILECKKYILVSVHSIVYNIG